MSDDHDTGVYCKHWLEPGICVECAKELCGYAALAAENEGLRSLLREMGEFLEYCRSSEVDEYDIDPLVKKITQALSRKAAP